MFKRFLPIILALIELSESGEEPPYSVEQIQEIIGGSRRELLIALNYLGRQGVVLPATIDGKMYFYPISESISIPRDFPKQRPKFPDLDSCEFSFLMVVENLLAAGNTSPFTLSQILEYLPGWDRDLLRRTADKLAHKGLIIITKENFSPRSSIIIYPVGSRVVFAETQNIFPPENEK